MNYEEGMEALEELGATPVPFICNDDGDYDTCHLRDSKPNEYSIVRTCLTEAARFRKAVEEMREKYGKIALKNKTVLFEECYTAEQISEELTNLLGGK